ncbi:MAG: hypothetical protein PHN75_11210, partial [Syntrophales bacterium]|nr:hypothetical protein [Syntrophales bacterium]
MITAVFPLSEHLPLERFIDPLVRSPLIERILVLRFDGQPLPDSTVLSKSLTVLDVDSPVSGPAVGRVIKEVGSKYILWLRPEGDAMLVPGAAQRLVEVADITDAGMVYGDYAERHVNDYQMGSIRDTFDFGPAMLMSAKAVSQSLRQCGALPGVRHAGLYDLRLKLAAGHQLLHISEPL